MAAGVLLLITLLTGHAMPALAIPQQAVTTMQGETASSASDSSKQVDDQTPAAPKTDPKDKKHTKPQRKTHVRLGTVSFGWVHDTKVMSHAALGSDLRSQKS